MQNKRKNKINLQKTIAGEIIAISGIITIIEENRKLP